LLEFCAIVNRGLCSDVNKDLSKLKNQAVYSSSV